MVAKNYKRVRFDFSEESLKKLDRLVEATDSVSRAETVRKALRFYDHITSMTNKGFGVSLIKSDEKIGVVMPW